MADSTLAAIRDKVRRLTRSPSEAQITTAQIDEYINTFVLYDFPEQLRLFTLRKTLTFYTQPYIGTYTTNTINQDDPLYNFKNAYITVHKPVFCAGYEMMYSQSKEEFNRIFPEVKVIQNVGYGDGINTAFGGTLQSHPVIAGSIIFNSIATDDSGISIFDQPIIDGVSGLPVTLGSLIQTNEPNPVGVINYVTGQFTFDFPVAPGDGEAINVQCRYYQPSRPTSMFYFNNAFTIRPIPDQVYEITIETYIRPTAILTGESPELEQWWQYIAYGAAKKIFEDRTDSEGVAMLMPEFKQQEVLVLRRTLVQQSNDRVYTIYTDSLDSTGKWSGNYR